jgi:gamma-glutamyltranspeptidase/glutathione hydrolase
MRLSHNALYPSRRSPVLARNVVAASQPLAAQAGLRMLLKGGNAADAALAAAIALVVVEPTGNGLGSDAFAIIFDGKELHGLNASGRSPKSFSPERFIGQAAMPKRGWDSVTVPAAISAWRDISRGFGALPFATLFEPAVDYADGGYNVSPIIAELWRRNAEELKDQPGFAEAWMPDGRAPRAGELFVNKPLAKSLRLIAESEGEAFYRGELAGRIADFAKAHGAAMTADDLAAHENDWVGTISQAFGDAELHEIPPNGQGIAALMTLGILRLLDIEALDPDSADALHLEIEAMKLAFADVGRFVADPRHMKTSPKALLDSSYLATRARLIDRKKAQVFGAGAPRMGGTVCLSAADASGKMVSYIQSNFSGFGSGVVVPGTSISLQNRGSGFTLEPGHPNEVGGAKRPFHTIIPGFVTHGGKPHMAFGLMGGPMQAQGHVQMFLRTQVWGQDPQTSADAPRWRFTSGLDVSIEPGYPDATMATLRERGHQITDEASDVNYGFGGAQLIARNPDGGYIAGSDPRKDGEAVGF